MSSRNCAASSWRAMKCATARRGPCSRATPVPVGVRQGARVEHEIGVVRHAVAVRKRLEQQRRAARLALHDALADQFAQLVHRETRRIHGEIGGIGHRDEQALLLLERLLEPSRCG